MLFICVATNYPQPLASRYGSTQMKSFCQFLQQQLKGTWRPVSFPFRLCIIAVTPPYLENTGQTKIEAAAATGRKQVEDQNKILMKILD